MNDEPIPLIAYVFVTITSFVLAYASIDDSAKNDEVKPIYNQDENIINEIIPTTEPDIRFVAPHQEDQIYLLVKNQKLRPRQQQPFLNQPQHSNFVKRYVNGIREIKKNMETFKIGILQISRI